jgi:DNA-binding transcriptional LysR family regulator
METLRLFCDVARLQSFSLGAREHGVTQSAASQRVAALERELGVTLLDRSVRPLALTPAGDLFFHEVRELLDRYDAMASRLARAVEPASGRVRVEAIYSAGIDLLGEVEREFRAQHPRIEVTIHYRRPEEVVEAVRDQRCDIGIVSYPKAWRGVNFLHLRDEPMVVICNPAHPLFGARKVRPGQLGAWPMIGFEPSLPLARQIRRYLRKHEVEPKITNVFDNIDTLKNAVSVTGQIAIVPARTVAREVKSGSLWAMELRPRLRRPMGVIYRRRIGAAQALAPAAQLFVDVLLARAGPEADPSAEPVKSPAAPARREFVAGGKA